MPEFTVTVTDRPGGTSPSAFDEWRRSWPTYVQGPREHPEGVLAELSVEAASAEDARSRVEASLVDAGITDVDVAVAA